MRIVIVMLLVGCGHVGPPKLEFSPGGTTTLAAVADAYQPYLSELRAELKERNGAEAFAGGRALSALASARDDLLVGLGRFADAVHRHAPPSPSRRRRLEGVLGEASLLCDGNLGACTENGFCRPALELGVFDKEKFFTTWPIARAWLIPVCRNYRGAHCLFNPFTYVVLLPLAALDVGGFFLGSWWWAGRVERRRLPLGPVSARRRARVRRRLLRYLGRGEGGAR